MKDKSLVQLLEQLKSILSIQLEQIKARHDDEEQRLREAITLVDEFIEEAKKDSSDDSLTKRQIFKEFVLSITRYLGKDLFDMLANFFKNL